MKYRKISIVVDATQWFKNGDHPLDYVGVTDEREKTWEGKVVRFWRNPDIYGYSFCKHCKEIMLKHGWIDTLEGGHIVCPGDWIVTGVHGEYYPVKNDIFAKTYEAYRETPRVTEIPHTFAANVCAVSYLK
jgi:hypothetical protein